MASFDYLNEYRDYIQFPDLANVQLSAEDFLPSGYEPQKHKDEIAQLLHQLEPIAKALETAAFAIPEFGVAASAAVGLLWGAIQPAAIHEYQKPVDEMIKATLKQTIESAELKDACSALESFNNFFQAATEHALPKTDSDVSATEELAKQFKGYVDPDGLLDKAFRVVKDRLQWFDTSIHSLLISIMQSILQAYIIRLACWQSLAYRARGQGNIVKYNEAQREVCYLLDYLKHQIPNIKKAIEQRIADLKLDRYKNCEVRYTTQDIPLLQRIYITREYPLNQDTFRTSGWVHDPASNRDLLHANVIPGKPLLIPQPHLLVIGLLYQKITRPSGANDDLHFTNIMTVALTQYKDRLLQAHIDEPWVELLKGVNGISDQAEQLQKKRLPGKPQRGPVFIRRRVLCQKIRQR